MFRSSDARVCYDLRQDKLQIAQRTDLVIKNAVSLKMSQKSFVALSLESESFYDKFLKSQRSDLLKKMITFLFFCHDQLSSSIPRKASEFN